MFNRGKSKEVNKDQLDTLEEMIGRIERLPDHVMVQPITHYDFLSLLYLMKSLFREESSDSQKGS